MQNRNTILIVDDQETNRAILRHIFCEQYTIIEAEDGLEAIEQINKHEQELVLILLDIIMPNMNGFDVLHFMAQASIDENVPVMLITSDTSLETEMKGYEYKVADLVTKPFDVHIVMRRVTNIIELYNHKRNLEITVNEQYMQMEQQFFELQSENGELIQQYRDTCENFCSILAMKMGDAAHIRRIKAFTSILCKYLIKEYPEYHIDRGIMEKIVEASMYYDIGMTMISDAIILKPDKLTEEERDIMKLHTIKGVDIVKKLNAIHDKETLRFALDICKYHHERYDGKGYPEELVGDTIPIAAQIVSVAEAYAALLRRGSYRNAFSQVKAEKMILDGKCGSFNPKLLDCFNLGKEEMRAMIISGKYDVV